MRSKSDEVEPFDNLLCGNAEDLEVQSHNAEVEAEEIVAPGSIHDVLRLKGGGKDGSSSDEEASMGRGGFQTDDDEQGLRYGSDGSDLSDLLDEELNRVQDGNVELMELSDNYEEGGNISMDTSAPRIVSMEQSEEMVQSILENILADAQVGGGDQVDDQVDDKGEEANSGAKFLQQLDRDYLCSPRMVVRGVYVGEVLKLIVRRKTEGTYVDWTILNMKTKTLVLNIKGEMTYPYGLSREAQGTKFGHEVMGGWRWRGYGWGFINLFPNPERADPTKILHVDIEEAIFFQESIFHHYHLSGRNCIKVNSAADIDCKQRGCGVKIWSIKFTTYTTAEEVVEYYQPRRRRKEKEEQHVYLSLVAFFDGDFKIVLHRDSRLKKYCEEVAWLRKDVRADFNDSVAAVDRLKIEKARLIWETTVPKPRSEGDTLSAQVIVLCVAK